jgi:hypothetical protein
MENEIELKQLAIKFVESYNQYDQFDVVMGNGKNTPLSSQTKMEIDNLVKFIKLNY